MHYFIFIICITYFRSLLFRRCDLQKSWKSSRRRLWAAASGESMQVIHGHVDLICFLPLVTLLHASLKLNTYLDTFRIRNCVWVELLSLVVISYHTSLPSLWCWVCLVVCWELWSSIRWEVRWLWWGWMLWFEQRLVWWRWLNPSGDVVARIF
jgi:hypothetical protein